MNGLILPLYFVYAQYWLSTWGIYMTEMIINFIPQHPFLLRALSGSKDIQIFNGPVATSEDEEDDTETTAKRDSEEARAMHTTNLMLAKEYMSIVKKDKPGAQGDVIRR